MIKTLDTQPKEGVSKEHPDGQGERLPDLQPVRLLFSRTGVASEAVDQLKRTMQLPGMLHVVGMPDLHPGMGSPVGAVFTSERFIHPKLIGGDIGCGMSLSLTTLPTSVSAEKLARKLGSIDGAWEGSGEEFLRSRGVSPTGFERALGTIGGGNHFAELQTLHEVKDPEAAVLLGLDKKRLLLLVHSGSRGFGQKVLNDYNADSRGEALEATSEQGQAYLAAHDIAVKFAAANRELIAQRFIERLGGESQPLINLCHNLVEQKELNGDPVWVHRKGASAVGSDAVVIPGSRGSYTYIVQPLGKGIENAFSLPHGAGRKIARSRCEEKFSGMKDLERPRDKDRGINSLVICEDQSLLAEEYSGAYKDVDHVVEDMVARNLVKVIAILRPVLTYKTRGEDTDGDG